MRKMVVGCWLVGLRLLLAQSVVGAGVAQAVLADLDPVERYYDTSGGDVRSFPIDRVRTVEVRVGMALGSEAKDEAAVRALHGRHATISFDAYGLPVIGVDDGDDAGLDVWGKERLADTWWVTPHVPAKHYFFCVTEAGE